jgi:hypothetical protein
MKHTNTFCEQNAEISSFKQVVHIKQFGFEGLMQKSIYLALTSLIDMMRHNNKL